MIAVPAVYGYDFDGVISIGVFPSKTSDIIITGRCLEESDYVLKILKERGITNKVYFNPLSLEERGNHTEKSRILSGQHKAQTIKSLYDHGIQIIRFFEDDLIQFNIIKKAHPQIEIVFIESNLVEK